MRIETVRSALAPSARWLVLFGILCTLGIGILRGGDHPAVPSAEAAVIDLGDINCDGSVDFGDTSAFFLALLFPDGYADSFPDCNPKFGDVNRDNHLDGADIDLFFACLEAGQCLP